MYTRVIRARSGTSVRPQDDPRLLKHRADRTPALRRRRSRARSAPAPRRSRRRGCASIALHNGSTQPRRWASKKRRCAARLLTPDVVAGDQVAHHLAQAGDVVLGLVHRLAARQAELAQAVAQRDERLLVELAGEIERAVEEDLGLADALEERVELARDRAASRRRAARDERRPSSLPGTRRRPAPRSRRPGTAPASRRRAARRRARRAGRRPRRARAPRRRRRRRRRQRPVRSSLTAR